MTAGDKIKKTIIYILLTLLAAACMFPFLLMMVNATRDGVEITRSFTLIPSTHIKENWETVFSFFNLFKGSSTGNTFNCLFFSNDSIRTCNVQVPWK